MKQNLLLSMILVMLSEFIVEVVKVYSQNSTQATLACHVGVAQLYKDLSLVEINIMSNNPISKSSIESEYLVNMQLFDSTILPNNQNGYYTHSVGKIYQNSLLIRDYNRLFIFCFFWNNLSCFLNNEKVGLFDIRFFYKQVSIQLGYFIKSSKSLCYVGKKFLGIAV